MWAMVMLLLGLLMMGHGEPATAVVGAGILFAALAE